jgi:Holliday junction DNA helicase RuvA
MDPGTNAFLFTHLHVREDAMTLFGFPSRDERDTFEALIAATGVGPKLGLAILSVHTPGALRRGLADDDLDLLMLVPGVGKRTAQRLLIELKARLEVPDLDLGVAVGATSTPRSEVRDALIGLGYSPDEVRAVLGQLADDGTVEELLRDALRVLAGSR